jgi:hypothetical protein
MTEERRDRLWDLFDRAADLTPSAQQSLLDAACPNDPDLRAEVEKFLADDARLRAAEGASDFLCSPVVHAPPKPPTEGPIQVDPTASSA